MFQAGHCYHYGMSMPGTSASSEWRCTSQININSNVENPTTCVRFDPYEELVWIGSATGKVSSYLPSSGNPHSRYTAYVVSRVSPVHCLQPTESAIFSLTDTMLRANTRQGIPFAKFSSPSMTKMSAMCHIPNTTNFILGGHQQKLIHYDYMKEKEIRTTDLSENGAVIIRNYGSQFYSADNSGNIHVRASKTCETVQTINAHGDRVLDFDVHGTKIVTCGVSVNYNYSSRHKATDLFIKVFDIRNYRALPPMGIPIAPRFVRFIPSYCDRLAIVFQSATASTQPNVWNYHGGIKMVDMESMANPVTVTLDGPAFVDMDFSSNKQFMAVANQCGIVSLFADRDAPLVNDHSKETIFAAPPVQPPISFAIDDLSQTFGSIPLQFPNEPFLSDWPTEFTEIRHRRLKPAATCPTGKNIHYARQIENPRANTKLRLHNVVPYILDPIIEKRTDPPGATPPQSAKKERLRVSKLYRRPPAQPPRSHRGAKRADQTMESYTWNVLRHVTFSSPSALQMLVNTIVHVVYAAAPLRDVVLRHLCLDEACITCELHFLFIALSSNQIASPINTANLSWSLLRHGVALGTGMFPALHQVIHTVLYDVSQKSQLSTSLMPPPLEPMEPTELAMTSKLEKHFKCTLCGAQQEALPDEHSIWTLDYDEMIQRATLCQMLERAVHLGDGKVEVEERKCAECERSSNMEIKRKLLHLAPMLLVDANCSSNGYIPFWRQQIANFEQRPTSFQASVPPSPAEAKPCRYGAACKRQGVCKYKHGLVDWADEQAKLLEHVDSPGWAHYIPSRLAVLRMADGEVKFSDISDSPDYDEPQAQIYELVAMIDLVGNGEGWTHAVTMLRESPVSSTEWTLINEQLVSRIHSHEARSINDRWKVPALLTYKRKGYEVATEVQKIPEHVFFVDDNLAGEGEESKAIRSVDELPGEGELVGLDCEFIKVQTNFFDFGKSTPSKAIGRASMVNSTGDKVIFDDHVVLGEHVIPLDYLTQYSGILEDDLNPEKSKKFLTSHKRVLLRMLVLQQRGVIFVGHALQNDFGVMNIHIPETSVIDTVELWKKETDRMLSLQFLAKMTLGEKIQEAAHDSVIDAQYALKIYHRYLEIMEKNQLAEILPTLYSYMPSDSPSHHSGSPLVVYTNQMKTIEDSDAPPSL